MATKNGRKTKAKAKAKAKGKTKDKGKEKAKDLKTQKQVLIPIATGACESDTIVLATTLKLFEDIVVVLALVDDSVVPPANDLLNKEEEEDDDDDDEDDDDDDEEDDDEEDDKVAKDNDIDDIEDGTCRMLGGFRMSADISIQEALEYDWDLIVLPGGFRGAMAMQKSEKLIQLLQRQKKLGKLLAASGAAPATVFAHWGLAPPEGASMTCYPKQELRNCLDNPTDDDIVIYNNIVTCQGAGSVFFLAVELGGLLLEDTAKATAMAQKRLVNRTAELGLRRKRIKKFRLKISWNNNSCSKEKDDLVVEEEGKKAMKIEQEKMEVCQARTDEATRNANTSQDAGQQTTTEPTISKRMKFDKTTLRKAVDCNFRFIYFSSQDRERMSPTDRSSRKEKVDAGYQEQQEGKHALAEYDQSMQEKKIGNTSINDTKRIKRQRPASPPEGNEATPELPTPTKEQTNRKSKKRKLAQKSPNSENASRKSLAYTKGTNDRDRWIKPIVVVLKELGWTIHIRNNRRIYEPPGTQLKCHGIELNTSTKLIGFLRGNSRWRSREETKAALKVYEAAKRMSSPPKRRGGPKYLGDSRDVIDLVSFGDHEDYPYQYGDSVAKVRAVEKLGKRQEKTVSDPNVETFRKQSTAGHVQNAPNGSTLSENARRPLLERPSAAIPSRISTGEGDAFGAYAGKEDISKPQPPLESNKDGTELFALTGLQKTASSVPAEKKAALKEMKSAIQSTAEALEGSHVSRKDEGQTKTSGISVSSISASGDKSANKDSKTNVEPSHKIEACSVARSPTTPPLEPNKDGTELLVLAGLQKTAPTVPAEKKAALKETKSAIQSTAEALEGSRISREDEGQTKTSGISVSSISASGNKSANKDSKTNVEPSHKIEACSVARSPTTPKKKDVRFDSEIAQKTVWKTLSKLGWFCDSVQIYTRQKQRYHSPVTGQYAKKKKREFDSLRHVLTYIRKDPDYSSRVDVMEALATYNKALEEKEQPRSNPPEQTSLPKRHTKSSASNRSAYFYDDIWPLLESLGWRLERLQRETRNDRLFFPPTVTKETGRLRVDYFDSIKRVVQFLNSRQEAFPGIYDALKIYESGGKASTGAPVPSESMQDEFTFEPAAVVATVELQHKAITAGIEQEQTPKKIHPGSELFGFLEI